MHTNNYFSVVFVGVKYVNMSASGFLAITLTAIISIFIRNSSSIGSYDGIADDVIDYYFIVIELG